MVQNQPEFDPVQAEWKARRLVEDRHSAFNRDPSPQSAERLVRAVRAWQDRNDESRSALTQVNDAWTDEGPVPAYHRAAKARLMESWPTLAVALDRLAQAVRHD